MFTNDVEYFVGRSVKPLTGAGPSIPQHWLKYLDADTGVRLSNLPADLAPLKTLMPKTYASLLSRVKEIFVIQEGDGVIRVLNKTIEDTDDLYSYISKPPLNKAGTAKLHPRFLANAPAQFSDLYRIYFDGLFDASLSGGFLPLSEMTPLSEMAEDFSGYPWYPKIRDMSRLEDILLIFSSGGGGYLFLDLRVDQSQLPNPVGMLVMNDADESPEVNVPFWDYLDAWTSIAMGD